MRNLKSLCVLVPLFSLGYAVVLPIRPALRLESHAVSGVQLAQVPMGRRCVTPRGSCDTPRSPVNTLCYCGNERGVVR